MTAKQGSRNDESCQYLRLRTQSGMDAPLRLQEMQLLIVRVIAHAAQRAGLPEEDSERVLQLHVAVTR